jgi:nicotinate-nucleotide adenylyltransferase
VTTGLLGGTFNPPHNGHIKLAQTAKDRFGLDELRVLVAANPPHKEVDVDADTRVALAKLAFPEDIVVRDDHPYSIDSVTGFGDDAIFLVGADQFAAFLTWERPDDLLDKVRLGVATRPGYPREVLDGVLSQLRRPERVELFEMEPVPISSSEVRGRVALGEPIDGLVPDAVAREIERRHLYARDPGYSGAA